jgi:predicted acylesterase/phospholipase RssA
MDPYLLIDGVATAPLPVKVLCENNIDIKIAVNIPQLDLIVGMKRNPKLYSIYLRSRSMMAHEMVNAATLLANIVIEPELKLSRLMDWDNLERFIDTGSEATKSTIEHVNTLLYKSGNKKRG